MLILIMHVATNCAGRSTSDEPRRPYPLDPAAEKIIDSLASGSATMVSDISGVGIDGVVVLLTVTIS